MIMHCFSAVINAGVAGCCTGLALSFPGILSSLSLVNDIILNFKFQILLPFSHSPSMPIWPSPFATIKKREETIYQITTCVYGAVSTLLVFELVDTVCVSMLVITPVFYTCKTYFINLHNELFPILF